MRKTWLDELSQFFNILKDEMSFVGPSSEHSEIVHQYEENFPEYRSIDMTPLQNGAYRSCTGVRKIQFNVP
ncbi:MAG: hypothetical protein GX217_08875 [Clostridiaceae bacterium]|nr:hypothetical protein [Clostridiaceae bacterium]